VQRHQLPLALNWASTVHRVQGDTLERMLLDLTWPIFAHGQLYTALTRVQGRDKLWILTPEDTFCDEGTKFVCTNIVHKEILQTMKKPRKRQQLT
jgi:ATP-dependent exoDNAse (exonuclease V) alpha subunit